MRLRVRCERRFTSSWEAAWRAASEAGWVVGACETAWGEFEKLGRRCIISIAHQRAGAQKSFVTLVWDVAGAFVIVK
jgi:hypothetical protein